MHLVASVIFTTGIINIRIFIIIQCPEIGAALFFAADHSKPQQANENTQTKNSSHDLMD
jgi:hypothetical protein